MNNPLLPERLTSERLLLRRPVKSDITEMFDIYSDSDVAHWLSWPVYSDREKLTEDVARYDELWKRGEEYYWVIEVRDKSSVVGSIACGVSGADADIGFMIGSGHQRRGYATEAAHCLLDQLKTSTQIDRVVAIAAVGNEPSIAVLEKIGMDRKGVTPSFMVCPNISTQPRDAIIYSMDCKA